MQQQHPQPCAPKQRKRTPAGLLLPIHTGLRGRVRWQVLDERGVPEIPRNPSGFAIAPIEGVEQSNLITNAGLDDVAVRVPWYCGLSTSVTAASSRRTLAVGTGSVAPAFTDTALNAEAQAAADAGAFDDCDLTDELDATANVYRRESVATRIITMTADRNLTEYGFRNGSGDLAIRELFRDELGDPATISLLNGKIIKVTHTLTSEVAAPAAGTTATIDLEEYDATNTLVGTTPYSVLYGPAANSASNFFRGANPTFPEDAFRITAAPGSYDRAAEVPAWSNMGECTKGTYTPGSYELEHYKIVAAGVGTGLWYGFHVGYAGNGYVVLFTSPTTYDKPSTHTLRVGILHSWGRA